MTKSKCLFAASLLIMDLGAFLIFVSFLPRISPGVRLVDNFIFEFFKYRIYWDRAWAFLIALLIISVGLFLAFNAMGLLKDSNQKKAEESTGK